MIEVSNQTKTFINSRVRRAAGVAKSLYAFGIELKLATASGIGELLASGEVTIVDGMFVATNPETVLDDQLIDRTQITTGQLCILLNTMKMILDTVESNTDIQKALVDASVGTLDLSV